MPDFQVVRDRPGLPPARPSAGVWVLRPEGLDDSGFQTTFSLSLTGGDGLEVSIGQVKIGKIGVARGPTPLSPLFSQLGADFMSVGAELDYYERLESLPDGIGRSVLAALCDIAFDPERRARMVDEPVVKISLLRFTPARSALERGTEMFGGRSRPVVPGRAGLRFLTSTGGGTFKLDLAFDGDDELPGRINVLVGPNGTGKTRLLANLALAAFEPVDEPTVERPWGRVEDGLSISRILAFSYSAFDDFDVPGDRDTLDAILEGSFRLGYGYFGLRDLSSRADGAPDGVLLKSQRRILEEFREGLGEALDRDGELLREVLTDLFSEASFALTGALGLDEIGGLTQLDLSDRLVASFIGASTGHKFILLMTTQLVAQTREGSLVLVDEPEAHLHPPLLAKFLSVVRLILARQASWAIVATHSPFIVQETPSRQVHVISRYISETTATRPEMETFGEDVGTITREVFRLDTRAGEYVELVQGLASRHSLDEIEGMFENGMSSQARSLVLAYQRRSRP